MNPILASLFLMSFLMAPADPARDPADPGLDKTRRVLVTDLKPSSQLPTPDEIAFVCEQMLRALRLDDQVYRVESWVYSTGMPEIVDEYESAVLSVDRAKLEVELLFCEQVVSTRINLSERISRIDRELTDAELTIKLLIDMALSEN